MSGKLHLICMKIEGYHTKIRCILNDYHTSVKRRKITFNSYNYNFFFIHAYSVFIIMFSLNNTFPANSSFRAFRL